MSNSVEPIELDESILNHEEHQAAENIDLNDDQIAMLLGDDVPKEALPSEDHAEVPISAPEVVEDEVVLLEEDVTEQNSEDHTSEVPNAEKSAPVVVEDEIVLLEEDVTDQTSEGHTSDVHNVEKSAPEAVEDEVVLLEENVKEKEDVLTDNTEIVLDDEDVVMENGDSEKKTSEDVKEAHLVTDNDLIIEEKTDQEDVTKALQKHSGADDDLIIDEKTDQKGTEDVQKANDIQMEEEDSSSSRKRANSNGALRSPVPKRKRRVHTYFATRQAAINLVTQILGSYDGTLYRKDLQLLTDFSIINKEQMFRANQEHVKRLRTENKKLREQLNDEKRAHQVTLRKLLSIDKEMQDMRDSLKELMPMLTQPCTPEVEHRLFQKQYQMASQPRDVHIPPERVSIPASQPPRPFVQRRVPVPATSSGNFYVPSPPTRSPVAPMRILPQPAQYRPVAAPPARRVAQRGGPPTWQPIPLPATNLGHEHTINTIATPQNLKDDTDASNANTIMLCVPFIQPARIFPFMDRPAMIPHRFKSLTPSAHLSVVINSTAADFRDNWQIGGRVSYEKLKNLHKKKIQVFVQVSSFKACGMGAHLPMSNDPIEWGISSAWPCKPKMHKFRIRFHHQQQIPQDDRVTVFAVAWSDNGTVDISVPATIMLS